MSANPKNYDGAPFGSQKRRFEVSGTDPRRRMPGTITQVNYDKKSMDPLTRNLGPGSYEVKAGDFSEKKVLENAAGPGWLRSYETKYEAEIPHLLYREEWENTQRQKEQLGPGKHNLHDSLHELRTKPVSTLGICQTRDPRFKDDTESNKIPGPGTYGKGGIPAAAAEEKALQSTSTVGYLDAGDRSRALPHVGSKLCPGQYNHKSIADEVNERKVSKRGPYDVFTGDRNKPIHTGHLAAPKHAHLGPGQYEIPTFLQEWKREHKMRHGRFKKVARMGTKPSEWIVNGTLSQWPRKAEEPGPGTYDPSDPVEKLPKSAPAFGSSAQRMDKKAMTNFTGSTNKVGPGRYNILHFHEKEDRNGFPSAFKSGVKRYNPTRDKHMQERLSSKSMPLETRKKAMLLPVS